jgi:hypothetical protein
MSSGHRHAEAVSLDEVEAVLAKPEVKKLLKRRKQVDRSYDIPYLAGYSQDGSTIYIDRHLPKSFEYRGREIPIDQFLILHEETEKALIDALRWTYAKAHDYATRREEMAVEDENIPAKIYEGWLEPYIKVDEHEKIKRVPLDLDLTPYRDSRDEKLMTAIRAAQAAEAA